MRHISGLLNPTFTSFVALQIPTPPISTESFVALFKPHRLAYNHLGEFSPRFTSRLFFGLLVVDVGREFGRTSVVFRAKGEGCWIDRSTDCPDPISKTDLFE